MSSSRKPQGRRHAKRLIIPKISPTISQPEPEIVTTIVPQITDLCELVKELRNDNVKLTEMISSNKSQPVHPKVRPVDSSRLCPIILTKGKNKGQPCGATSCHHSRQARKDQPEKNTIPQTKKTGTTISDLIGANSTLNIPPPVALENLTEHVNQDEANVTQQ